MKPPTPDEFAWIELAARRGTGMARNHFVAASDPEAVTDWRREHRNRDVYASVCRFQEPDRDSPYTCDLVLDIDGEDLQLAKRQTEGICDRLIRRWELDPGWLRIAFSGAKGFHIEIPRAVFGDPPGSALMRISRALARRLVKDGFGCVDDRIYQHTRILRLPNSIHTTTSLYKIPLEYAELLDLELEYICEHAREPREDDVLAVPADEAPKAVGWLHEARDWCAKHARRSRRISPADFQAGGWRCPPCIRRIERAALEDGRRHDTLFALAQFYAAIGMAPEEIACRLGEINQRNPIRDPDYIERLARDARQYANLPACPNPALAPFCERGGCFLSPQDEQAGLVGTDRRESRSAEAD